MELVACCVASIDLCAITAASEEVGAAAATATSMAATASDLSMRMAVVSCWGLGWNLGRHTGGAARVGLLGSERLVAKRAWWRRLERKLSLRCLIEVRWKVKLPI